MEPVQLFLIDLAGVGGVDAGDVQAAVAQQVGQAGQVSGHVVVHSGEEVAQVVGEDLFSGDACFFL